MNHRLTITAALAVVFASISLSAVITTDGWLYAGIGAVATVALAGTLTRLSSIPAAVAATCLTAVACVPLFAHPSWHWKLPGLVIVAVIGASATRLRVLPVIACVATYLAALLTYLNIVFASGESFGRLLPSAHSLQHMSDLLSAGWGPRFQAPPVPGGTGINLLAAAGIGLIAVATDVLAVRLRSPAVAGLPLLVLFSVPITTSAHFSGAGATIAFCFAITGYLALLAADGRDRLRIWGRLVTVWQSSEAGEQGIKGPDTRALAAAGRRIGLAAVCFAVLTPLILPALHVRGVFTKHVAIGPGRTVQLPAPLDLMKSQLTSADAGRRTVLTFTTSGVSDASTQYLQLYVLNFDASERAFTIVQTTAASLIGSKPLRPAPGLNKALTPVVTAHTRISIASATAGYGSKLNFLPVPYAPTLLNAPGVWEEDNATLMIYSGQTGLGGLHYTVTSTVASPTPQQLNEPQTGLPASVIANYTGYHAPDEPAILAIAKRVTKGATTSYQRALDLQTWFTSGHFKYSLKAKFLNTPAALLKFLTTSRSGYCQQFAYAMTTLARVLGIPARIAVGYTAGTVLPNGTRLVTEADAHAWPELYFQGVGWLRFEPTPGGGEGGQGTATLPVDAGGPVGGGGGGPQGGGPSTGQSTQPKQDGSATQRPGAVGIRRPDTGSNSGGGTISAHSGSPAGWILLAVAIILALAAIAPGTARLLTRRRRWQRAAGDARVAHAAWRELRDDMTDFGLACRASESPRAIARRVGKAEGLDQGARDALNRIARAEERASYAQEPEAAGPLRADVLTVRRAVARNADRGARWRARLLPASTLEPVRAVVQQSLDVFGWMDAAGQRLRRRVAGDAISIDEA